MGWEMDKAVVCCLRNSKTSVLLDRKGWVAPQPLEKSTTDNNSSLASHGFGCQWTRRASFSELQQWALTNFSAL